MNQVVVIGNVGGEPELRYTKSGKPLLTFSVASNRKVRDEETTTWHQIEVWDRLAENSAASLTSGVRVIVVGRQEQFSWADRESGEKRTKTLIVANDVGVSLSRIPVSLERPE